MTNLIYESEVEEQLISDLQALGYEYAHGPSITKAEEGGVAERDYGDVVFQGRLRAALIKLNPKVPVQAIEMAVQEIMHYSQPNMVKANQQMWSWIKGLYPVSYQENGVAKDNRLKLIDFDNFKNNIFRVINQMSIKGNKMKRPDVIIEINGLPLIVMELKNPNDMEATLESAFQQIATYKEEIPDLFKYNALIILSDNIEAKMGSLTSSMERYYAWESTDGQNYRPYGEHHQLKTLVLGLLKPETLIQYLKTGILFEENGSLEKKVAGYHQFYAVNSLTDNVLKAAKTSSNKGGIIWHTQGSGKSITMGLAAANLMIQPELKSPTLVVVTDRNDLDEQLLGTFNRLRTTLPDTPVKIENRKDLRAALSSRAAGGIIFTTIQKFSPGEDEDMFPKLSDRKNIIVFCDEAHRTQYGIKAKLDMKDGQVKYGYAKHLRDALPHAIFCAFTGTPIAETDRDTQKVFGEYAHIYGLKQAVDDGATVPIYYESRLIKLHHDEANNLELDAYFEGSLIDADKEHRQQIKQDIANLENIMTQDVRVKEIAQDISNHFAQRNNIMDGKGMVVAVSRLACVKLHDELVKLNPGWASPDINKGKIKIIMTGSSSDKPEFQPHIYGKVEKDTLAKRFKDPTDELRLVLVCDMWLTGFDVPCLHTMYIDKPMKNHSLMQAIARVNRVFRNKAGGLVVDYIGIAPELKKALAAYDGMGKDSAGHDIEAAYKMTTESMEVIQSMLHGVDYSQYKTKGMAIKLVPKVADFVLGMKEGKQRFCDAVLHLNGAFSLCCTLAKTKEIREEIAFYTAIKTCLTKPSKSAAARSFAVKEQSIQQLLSDSITSEKAEDILGMMGLNKPNLNILDEHFIKSIKDNPYKNLSVELMERLLEGDIRSKFKNNILREKKFSEMLRAVILKYQNRSIETAQVIQELLQMAKDINAAVARGERLKLNKDEMAFYEALEANEASVIELGEEVLKKIATELTETLRNSLTVDWSIREDVRAKMRNKVRSLLKKYKYPPDKQEGAVNKILEQAQELGDEWAS